MSQRGNRPTSRLTDPVNTSDRQQLSLQRKTKGHMPDTDKDDSYWQKRHRNNVAAKKSRDIKRQRESSIEETVKELEIENVMLKTELSLLKARFGIPETHSLLSDADRARCMSPSSPPGQPWQAKVRKTWLSRPVGDKTCAVELRDMQSPYSQSSNDSGGSPEPNCSPFVGIPYIPSLGNVTHSCIDVNEEPNNKKRMQNTSNPELTNGCIENSDSSPVVNQSSYKYTLDSIPLQVYYNTATENFYPADLSTKKDNIWQDTYSKTPRHNIEYRPSGNTPVCENIESNISNSGDNEDISNDELRFKLQDLSSQVDKMQRLVSIKALS